MTAKKRAQISVATAILMGSGLMMMTTAAKPAVHAAKATAKAKAVTIDYWYPWGGGSQTYDLWRIKQFIKANPNVHFKNTYVPTDDGINNGKLLAAIEAGDAPTLGISSGQAQLSYALAQQGAFLPLNRYLKQDHYNLKDVIPSFLKLMKVGNNVDLFPETTNVDLLYYNKTLFKKAGLNPNDPPKTIAQLNADAAKLTVYQGKQIKQIGFIPWLDGGALTDEPFLWGWVFGANFYNPKTHQLELENPKLYRMFDWMHSYAKKYGASALDAFSSGFGGAFTPTDGFYSGKVAMVIHGNWYQEAIHQYAPKLNYGVAPIPYPVGGRKDASTFNTNLYFLPKNGKPASQAEAVKYMIFATSGRILASDVNEWMSIAVHKTTKDIKFYKNGKVVNPIYKVVLQVADSPNSGTPALTNVASELGTDLGNIMDDVIYHNQNPVPLLKALQQKLQPQVQK